MEGMTGVKPAEILGKNNYEYALPFYHERRPILIDLVLAPDEKFEREKYLYTIHDITMLTAETILEKPDGAPVHLWIKACRLFDKSGNLVGAIESIRDITGQKQAEEALRESEERYRNVVEDQTEFISRFLPDGTHVFVNEAYCRCFGMKRDEILGHRFRPKIPAEDQERVRQFFESLTRDHPVDSIEHRIIMPDNSIRWQRWSDRAIFDPAGTISEYQSVGQDITGQKQEEQALHENEQRLNSIYNTVGDSIFQLTVEPGGQFRFTSVNPAFSSTTGLPSGQVIGKKVNEIIPEPSLTMVLEKYRQAIQEKTIVRWEETSVYPKGQVTGEVSIAPIFDKEGHCTHLSGSVHDITGRKRMEEALRESEVRFRTIFENQQNGLIMVDAETHMIVDANRTALSLMGATRDDVIGRVCHTFICPAEEGKCPVTDLGQTVDMSERVLFTIKGERIPIIKSVSRITLGDRTYLIESFSDITDRKRADEALRASEEKYREIFENTTVAVFQTRIDGSIATANTAFARLLKYETPEIAIREIPSIRAIYVDPDVREELYRLLVTRGVVENFELALRRRDGSTLWASVNVRAVYGDDGKITGLEGLAVDITDRKKTEETLREVNKKLNLLSRITRHDINNQLMLLRAYLEILKEKQSDPSFTAPFQKVVNAAQHISSMIQFTREYEEIGVNVPVWQDCHALADTAAKDAPLGNIIIKNDLPSGTEVFADPLIVKVFYNLMDNAIRYGRKITTIRFSLQESGEDHLILCEDDGDGISADEKERIFERDFGRNTGLGLFLSQEVLAITGITIRETGVPGKGARFEMTVPKNAYRLTVTEQA
jgi:PAS domain S-box-containing protein